MTLYPGSYQVEPMKYCGSPNQNIIDAAMSSNNWIMQQKLDGALYMLEKIDNDHIYLFGRTKSKKTGELTEKIANVPHIKKWAELYVPNDTVLLGEIYVENGHSNDVTKIMGCLPEKAIERQENDNWITYNIFDCIRWMGEDICNKGFWERYIILEHYFIEILDERLEGFPSEDFVRLIPSYTLQNETHGIKCSSFQEQLNKIFAAGGEGAVFKKKDSIYRPGMRTTASQSFKMKEHIDSIDLVVMECLDPEIEYTGKEIDTWPYYYSLDSKKKYLVESKNNQYIDDTNIIAVTKPFFYNWKNAVRVGAYDDKGNLVEVGRVASGFTDENRVMMGANPQIFIGQVVECACMSVDKKELSLRHPVFLSFRFDKNPEECLLKDIFGE